MTDFYARLNGLNGYLDRSNAGVGKIGALGLAALFVLAPATADSQEISLSESPAEEQIPLTPEELSRRFVAPKFNLRSQAMLEGWRQSPAARDAIGQLLHSADPETARRAQWILDRWEIGLVPDLPSHVRRELAAADGQPHVAMRTLIDNGYLEQAVKVARNHFQSPAGDSLRNEFAEVVTIRYPTIILQAVEKEQLDLAIELLELCGITPPLIVARALLIDRLGLPLSGENVLPKCCDSWQPGVRSEVAVCALAVVGKLTVAAEVAKRIDRPDLLARIYLLEGKYRELAELDPQQMAARSSDDILAFALGLRVMAASEAQLDQPLVDSVQALVSAPIFTQTTMRDDLRWRVLATAGYSDAAIEIAKETNLAAAAELLSTGQQLHQALELLQADPGDPRRRVEEIFAAIEAPIASDEQQLDRNEIFNQERRAIREREQNINQLTTILKLLGNQGHDHWIRDSLRRLNRVSAPRNLATIATRDAIRTAARMGFEDLLAEMLVTADPTVMDTAITWVGFLVANQAPDYFKSLQKCVVAMRPQATAQQQWQMAIDLALGKLPQDWNPRSDLDRLYGLLVKEQRNSQSLVGEIQAFPGSLMGRMFAELGRDDLLTICFEHSVAAGYVIDELAYAQLLLADGRPDEADRLYQAAIERMQRTSTRQIFRLPEPYGASEPSVAAALAGQAVARQRLGDDQQAQRLLRAVELMPLEPAINNGEDYLDRLGALLLTDLQDDVAKVQIRFAVMMSDALAEGIALDASGTYGAAMGLAFRLQERQSAEATLWGRIALMHGSTSELLYPSGYLTVPARLSMIDAMAALDRNDIEETRRLVNRSLAYFPMNIDAGEEQLLKLREANQTAIADEALDRILATGRDYIARFPLDANAHNNLAWVSAKNERYLDQALQRAQHAVFLEPDSSSYRDTLAEVLFQLGRHEEATEIEQQCLLDTPDQWHIHEQIERFTAP